MKHRSPLISAGRTGLRFSTDDENFGSSQKRLRQESLPFGVLRAFASLVPAIFFALYRAWVAGDETRLL
jgi:hypothetical protein